jgi:chemotaxis signal transduction protein
MLLVLKASGLRPAGGRVGTDSEDVPAWSRRIALPAEMLLAAGGKHLILCRTPLPPGRQRPLALGFCASQVLEVLQPQVLQPVPLATADMLGLLRWRDWPVPVIDLAYHLGLPPLSRSGLQRVLVARLGDQPLGIAVTPQVRVLRLPVPNQPSVKPPAGGDLVRQTIELKTETVILPHLNALDRRLHRPAAPLPRETAVAS